MSGGDDGDRTIIRPTPGRRQAQATAAPSPTPAAAASPVTTIRRLGRGSVRQAEGTERLAIGATPLAAAAAPLLQLLARIRRTARPPQIDSLRSRAVQQLAEFDRQARALGAPAGQIGTASIALCASLDDAVLNTPWGSEPGAGWGPPTLLAQLHPPRPGAAAGDPVFLALKRLLADPGDDLPLLELLYLCLSLGYGGAYRTRPDGQAQLDRIRAATHAALVRARAPVPGPLAAHTTGIAAPWQPDRVAVPLWVGGVAAFGVVALAFLAAALALDAQGDRLYARMLAAAPATMPAISRAGPVQPPPPPPPAAAAMPMDRLRVALAAQLAAGQLALAGTPAAPVIRINDGALFAGAGTVVQRGGTALLQQLAAALAPVSPGAQVVGYTDDQVPRGRLSAFQLSAARARAVGAVLHQGGIARIATEGRGAADPVAANTAAASRAQNRRIDILPQAAGPG